MKFIMALIVPFVLGLGVTQMNFNPEMLQNLDPRLIATAFYFFLTICFVIIAYKYMDKVSKIYNNPDYNKETKDALSNPPLFITITCIIVSIVTGIICLVCTHGYLGQFWPE